MYARTLAVDKAAVVPAGDRQKLGAANVSCLGSRRSEMGRQAPLASQSSRPESRPPSSASDQAHVTTGSGRELWRSLHTAHCRRSRRAACRCGPGQVASKGAARHRRCIRAMVVPPSAGPMRGRLPCGQGTAVLMQLRVAGCDAAPRAWAGERGQRKPVSDAKRLQHRTVHVHSETGAGGHLDPAVDHLQRLRDQLLAKRVR